MCFRCATVRVCKIILQKGFTEKVKHGFNIEICNLHCNENIHKKQKNNKNTGKIAVVDVKYLERPFFHSSLGPVIV